MQSVCAYQVYQCTCIYLLYIYTICTHVHTPHEFSRPKHPDKNYSNSVTKFIHPKLGLHWLLESLGVQSSPSSRAASNSWSFSSEKLGTSVLSRWWLDRWKKCEGHHFEKKNSTQMIGTLHFNSTTKMPTNWQIFFFFQLPPIETITSQPINPNHQRSDAGLRILPRFGDDHHDHFGEVTGALAVWPA